MDEQSSILEIKGIGEKLAKLLQRLDIRTVGELLHYYPKHYENFSEPVRIDQLSEGQPCAIRAALSGNISSKKLGNRTVFNLTVGDTTGQLAMTYFNTPYIKNMLKRGVFYIFRGIPQQKNGRLVMEQAKIYKPQEYGKLMGIQQPVYGLTAGLTNSILARSIRQALEHVILEEDFLPEEIRKQLGLISHRQALEEIHFPPSQERMREARRRLVFEEFFLFLLVLRRCKEQNQRMENRYRMEEAAETQRLLEQLPYSLTNAQKRVWKEIQEDLQSDRAMNRLIQGDVGSGKTILAFLALLTCVAHGFQGAMMAPTEVLAKQHYEGLKELAEAYGLPLVPVLLTGSMTAKEKRLANEEIQTGRAHVVIGTHALIQERVEYKNLALVVTDEQHRFGVRQREALTGKGESVHVMVMSATPIPRTLAIILYGDLDLSVVDELPGGRLPIKNCVVGTDYREKAYRFLTRQIEEGRQVYVICPMVEEGELEGVENVTSYTEKLREVLPSNIQIACLHGKMRPAEKNKIMEAYASHHIDVLVSTTVIEVGINVPNATVMMVENAERFGLAQLHQLRGRVGRGSHQSYCIFVSGSGGRQTMERLEILNHSNDGFYISEEDLKLRGPGDMFGIRQSGLLEFEIADIYRDADLLHLAGEWVNQLLAQDALLQLPENARLHQYLETRWDMVDFHII
ncbi:MAG: ATP-dependent DNA helicase RecG [Lachnospiraceae bacterium]|nr:ATP-dependent DNA helicase RecG [Lachnospiraceae bacterium]